MAVVHNNKLSNAWYQDNTSDSNKKNSKYGIWNFPKKLTKKGILAQIF
jgi:hypothetical protein